MAKQFKKVEKSFSWKCPLSFKFYFLAGVYRITRTIFGKVYLALLPLFVIWGIVIGDDSLVLILILLIIFIFLFMPSFRFAFARVYHKLYEMEYYLKEKSVGYVIGSYNLDMKRENINKIVVKSDHLLVSIKKDKLIFWGNKEDLGKAVNWLEKSKYSDIVV